MTYMYICNDCEFLYFFYNDFAATTIYTLSLHDALPICWYQDDPDFGPDAAVTLSRTWTVDTGYVPPPRPRIRINEVLALNSTTLTNAGVTPDLIELYNYGATPVDLSGLGLTDNVGVPYKFSFPAGTP